MRIGASNGCKSSGSKQRGIAYHNRVYTRLRDRFGALGTGRQQAASEVDIERELLIEPWYKRLGERPSFRQPDAVLLFPEFASAIVIEVKLNWKDGRDVKLVDEYLPIVKQAEGLEVVWPLLITQCLRGYQHPPLKGLEEIDQCQSWFKGDPTPLMLMV